MALSAQAKGVTSPLGGGKESIVAPLYFEPGSKWEYGVGIDWLTPVGPLTFSFAHPITKESTDIEQTFRFNIGTSF